MAKKRRKKGDHVQLLKPIISKPVKYPLGAFDIEGVGGPGGYETGGVLTDTDYESFDTPGAMLRFMKRRKFKSHIFFAHNLPYDWGILFPYSKRDDYPILLHGRPYKVKLDDGVGNVRYLADSLLFSVGMPLAKIGNAIGLPKLATPPQLLPDETEVEEWYCSRHNKLWCTQCYLRRDVNIVLQYMNTFQETINDLGGQLKFTLASTAMDLFKRKHLDETYFTPWPKRNDFARQAYYGGRVEPFYVGKFEGMNVFDINSLYPHVMVNGIYPHPNYLVGPTAATSPKVVYNYEGVSEVTIRVPKTHVPVLPFRHADKLFFPYGTLKGTWTHIELREAVSRGAKILHVHYSLYSTQTTNPFVSYVVTLYGLRQKYKDANDPRELVIKILLNSLYGKFGQRTDGDLREIHPIMWWLQQRKKPPVIHDTIGGQAVVLRELKTFGQASYVNTLWASYVTGYARLELFRYLVRLDDDVFYTDTDSVFTTQTLFSGSKLGQMKPEAVNVEADIIAPKAYLLYQDGELMKAKCKGVPRDHKVDFLLNGLATFQRPTGLLEARKLNPKEDGTPYYPSEWRTVEKERGEVTPKRKLIPLGPPDRHQFRSEPHSVDHLPD